MPEAFRNFGTTEQIASKVETAFPVGTLGGMDESAGPVEVSEPFAELGVGKVTERIVVELPVSLKNHESPVSRKASSRP